MTRSLRLSSPLRAGRLLLVCCAGLIGACSPGSVADATPEATALAQQFIDTMKQEDYASTLNLYSDLFWQEMSRENWERILPNLNQKLGLITSCELGYWHQTTRAGSGQSGTFVSLQYECVHEKYDSVISFLVFKPLDGGAAKIQQQNVDSLGLLME